MQTSNLGQCSARLLLVSNSNRSSNSNSPYGDHGHQPSSQAKHPMVSLRYTKAWARHSRAPQARLLKVRCHKHQAMCRHLLPVA